jgi:serine/threonine protein kinase
LKCGSPAYWSPEIVLGKQVTQSTDIWCLGVLLYALVNGRFPFPGDDSITAQNLFDDITFSETTTAEFNALIREMLQKDVKKRIRIDSIVNHPWMRNQSMEQAGSPSLPFTVPKLHFFLRRCPASIRLVSTNTDLHKPTHGVLKATQSTSLPVVKPILKRAV